MQHIWSKADIHIHTTYSDGMASVRAMLDQAAQLGDLRVIAITDHDNMRGAIVMGCEVSSAEGHILALFIEHPITPGMSVDATIAAIHAQDGLAIAAHPYASFVQSVGRRMQRLDAWSAPAWRFDAIEVFNASLWHQADNERAAHVAHQLGLPTCGGSDAHSLATLGCGYTCFAGRSAADLRQALLTGQTRPGGQPWGWGKFGHVAAAFLRRDLDRILGPPIPSRRPVRTDTPCPHPVQTPC
ncbi:MAG: CehA/McbA family metallohydrolase [Roseiflexaceae bacterium]